MNKVCIIGPHADDETLGCGGAILRHKKNGDKVYWICVTSMKASKFWSEKQIKKRDIEIDKVTKAYGIEKFISLDLPPAELDTIPMSKIISSLSKVVNKIKPKVLYIPYYDDAHDDHLAVASAINALGKWFRYPFIKKIVCYETISETDFSIISENSFKPNLFIDITNYLKKKIEIMKIYKSEISKHPFPRSIEAIKSLALLRGSQSGYKYAEAYKILIERE